VAFIVVVVVDAGLVVVVVVALGSGFNVVVVVEVIAEVVVVIFGVIVVSVSSKASCSFAAPVGSSVKDTMSVPCPNCSLAEGTTATSTNKAVTAMAKP